MGTAPTKPVLSDNENCVESVKRGQTIALSWESNCGVYGKWKKGNKTLESGDRISISHRDYIHHDLKISNAKEEDEGEYTLVVWNRKGEEAGSATIKVLEFDVDWRKIDWEGKQIMLRSLGAFKLSKPDLRHLRFLLHGPITAGKSSIVNTINSVFLGRISMSAVAGYDCKSRTKIYKAYHVKDQDGKELPFVFNDIMGLESTVDGGILTVDIISALKGLVKDGYKFNPVSSLSENDSGYNSNPSLNDKVHCLVSVIPADKVTMLEDTSGFLVKMREVRQVASELGIPQVVLLTHVDTYCPVVKEDLTHIYSSKKIKQAMQHCNRKLGVPMNCIFPVQNYHEETRVFDKIDSLMLDALNQMVNFANDYVQGFTV